MLNVSGMWVCLVQYMVHAPDCYKDLSSKEVKQESPTRKFHKNFSKENPTGVSCKNVSRERLAKVVCSNVSRVLAPKVLNRVSDKSGNYGEIQNNVHALIACDAHSARFKPQLGKVVQRNSWNEVFRLVGTAHEPVCTSWKITWVWQLWEAAETHGERTSWQFLLGTLIA